MFPLVYCPSSVFETTALSVCTTFQPIFTKLDKRDCANGFCHNDTPLIYKTQ